MAAPRRAHLFLGVLALLAALPLTGLTQNNPPAPAAAGPMVQWRAFGGDDLSNRYSPLDQINRDNVRNLQVAWTWRFDNYGTATETITTETTPLMVNGVLYFTAGPRRYVVAANAATGETLWTYRPDEGNRFDTAPRKVHRGVAYWTDGKGRERIFTATPGYNLVALDAKTGQLVDSFGENGIVDMMKQMEDKSLDPVGKIGNSSPPVIANDVIVVGPALQPGGRDGDRVEHVAHVVQHGGCHLGAAPEARGLEQLRARRGQLAHHRVELARQHAQLVGAPAVQARRQVVAAAHAHGVRGQVREGAHDRALQQHAGHGRVDAGFVDGEPNGGADEYVDWYRPHAGAVEAVDELAVGST